MKFVKLKQQPLMQIILCIWLSFFRLLNAQSTFTVTGTTASQIQDAINSASNGDTILLNGVGPWTAPVGGFNLNNKVLKIKGITSSNGVTPITQINVPSGSTVVFNGTAYGTVFEALSIMDVATSTACNLAIPYALRVNFSLSLIQPDLKNNKIKIESDLGKWFHTRKLLDINFGTCNYTTNGDDGGTGWLTGRSLALTSTCRLRTIFYVTFSRLQNCGITPDTATTPGIVQYLSLIEAKIVEYVERINDTVLLRVPLNRTGNAVARLRIRIDRVRNVVATITINYQAAELQAVVTNVNITPGTNITEIEITITLPAPYTIGTGITGTTGFTGNETGLIVGNWTAGTACNNLAGNAICNQTLTLTIVGCDLTANYLIQNVPVICQASSSGNACPLASTIGAEISFYLDSLDFCKVNEFNLSSLFQAQIILRVDTNYNTDRPNSTFYIGDMTYWSIKIWTNETGVGVADARIIAAIRNSTGDCNYAPSYQSYFSDLNTYIAQTFVTSVTPPEIRFPLQATAAMACAMPSLQSSNVNFTYTVQVDYVDSTRRRRREVPYLLSRTRRDSGTIPANQDNVGFLTGNAAGQNPISPVQSPTTVGASNSNSTILYILLAILFVLLLCGCGLIFAVVQRRKKRREAKQAAMYPAGQMMMGANGMVYPNNSAMIMTPGTAVSSQDLMKSQSMLAAQMMSGRL